MKFGVLAFLCAAIEITGSAAVYAQTTDAPVLQVPARAVPVRSDVSPPNG